MLLDDCKRRDNYIYGYVASVVDSSFVYGAQKFCIPDGVTLGQVKDVFCRYLVDNPKHRHWVGAAIANNAISTTWPCDGFPPSQLEQK